MEKKEVTTLTIPTHSVRQRWNVRKVDETWKRRENGESTLEIANDIGCSPDALRQAWRQLGYFIQEPRLDLEPYQELLTKYRLGHSLLSLCNEAGIDYARMYAAMKYRGMLRPTHSRWAPAEIERLLHLEAEGWTHEEIGQELKRSPNSVKVQISRQYNEGDRRVRWPPHRIAKAKRLLENGMSKNEVALRLKTTSAALHNAMLRNGWRRNEKKRYTDEECQALKARLQAGENLDELAFELGIQANSLYILLKRRCG